MRRTRFMPTCRATKYEILATLRDVDRAVGPDATLETTIREWCADRDEEDDARYIGWDLNARFRVRIGDDDWLKVLYAEKATLDDVCEMIASRVRKPEIQPFRVGGTNCLSAGAFLTIRTALGSEGVPVDGVRPSTPLGPLACDFRHELWWALARIAPGVLPAPKVKYRLWYRLGWLFTVGGLVTLAVSLRASTPVLCGCLVPILGGAFLLRRYAPYAVTSVSYPGLATFRDLTESVLRARV